MLVTAQNFHRHTLSAPPRLFASECAPPDRECPSSQKIFPTQSLYAPATSTQPQRRNTDVRGRSYHVLKLSTPRQKPDSAGFGDTPRFGGVGRKWATHFVCNLSRRISDFSFFSSKEHPSRGRNGRPSQAGRARRTSLSEGGVTSSGVRRHTSRRITLARPAVALWRSGRGALRRQRGRGFESGRGAAVAAAKVALRRWSAVSVCGRTEASAWPWKECTVSMTGQSMVRDSVEDGAAHRSGNISLSHYIPRLIS